MVTTYRNLGRLLEANPDLREAYFDEVKPARLAYVKEPTEENARARDLAMVAFTEILEERGLEVEKKAFYLGFGVTDLRSQMTEEEKSGAHARLMGRIRARAREVRQ